jgi:hypothetical protein
MDHRRPVLRALALVSAFTVLGAVVIHAGCRNADPPQRVAAEPSARPSAAAAEPSAAPSSSASAAPAVSLPELRPSRIHMGASKSGLIVRPAEAASNAK